MYPQRVIVVEDERMTQRYIVAVLEKLGVEVLGCYDRAIDLFDEYELLDADLVLLDINVEGPLSGVEIAERLYQVRKIPVLFVTAYSDDATVEAALRCRPGGYLLKPFTDKELEIAVRVAVSRCMTEVNATQKSVETPLMLSDSLRFDPKNEMLFDDDKRIRLNNKQLRLLKILAAKPNHTVNYYELEHQLWPDDEVSISSLKTLVYSLRKKVPGLQIETMSKSGYRLVCAQEVF